MMYTYTLLLLYTLTLTLSCMYIGCLSKASQSTAAVRLAPVPVFLPRGAGLCRAAAGGHEQCHTVSV